MLEILHNNTILNIDPKNVNNGKIIFDKTKCGTKVKARAKDYIVEFFVSLINYEGIGLSDPEKGYLYNTLECTNFKTTKTQYIIDYKMEPTSNAGFIICNHFYTAIKKDGNDIVFADKKYSFEHFDINYIGYLGDNFTVKLKSSDFEYFITKFDGVYDLLNIYDLHNCKDSKFIDKFETLMYDLNMFIVDNKFMFNINDLNAQYKCIIQNILNTRGSGKYTKNIIAEELNMLNSVCNKILNSEVKNA